MKKYLYDLLISICTILIGIIVIFIVLGNNNMDTFRAVFIVIIGLMFIFIGSLYTFNIYKNIRDEEFEEYKQKQTKLLQSVIKADLEKEIKLQAQLDALPLKSNAKSHKHKTTNKKVIDKD